ncbi:Uncharacterized protein FWK35_00024507, partial [Aphis craccivora]
TLLIINSCINGVIRETKINKYKSYLPDILKILKVSKNLKSREKTEEKKITSDNIVQNVKLTKISELKENMKEWTVKGRITNKPTINTFHNNGNKLFNFDLIDTSGEIRCVAFGRILDQLYDLIKIQKVYYVSPSEHSPYNLHT